MILISAFASAQFPWSIQELPRARWAFSAEINQAIRERRTPVFTREEERFLYAVTIELNTTSTLSESTFRRGLELFNEENSIGFYR